MFDITRRNGNRHSMSYNPFKEMEDFEQNFFQNPFAGFFGGAELAEFKTDVTDEGDCYVMEADLPGFDKNDIKIDLNDNTLTIRAERHSRIEEKDKKNKIVRMERAYGSYSRNFDISDVDAEQIKAKYDNGVLKLTLPKKEHILPKSRQLEIE